MKIKEIQDILEAKILCGAHLLDTDVTHACAADLMSDVLAYDHSSSVLLTGLCNPQVVRTAEMLDIRCLVFVRNKAPDEQTLELAKSKDIVVMTTYHMMFSSCGLLYQNGMRGGA
ncbi:MAG: DRTGG domain-containing protein [Lachnospiraceae bacterium]|nr:DRTGG domain-containing protein [Lachnospiraceae bacterium]